MKFTHYVTIPVTAEAHFSFESDVEDPSFDDVVDAFYRSDVESLSFRAKDGERPRDAVLETWEIHEHLNRGNVCHAVCPEWSLDETEEHDESDQ